MLYLSFVLLYIHFYFFVCVPFYSYTLFYGVRVMVFNSTFNIISDISRLLVLLVGEIRVAGKKH